MKVKPLSVLLILVVSGAMVHGLAQHTGTYHYVGWRKCQVCHGQEAVGNQCKIWQSTGHSRAHEILATDTAKGIAENAGVANPQEDLACLKCHTTGGGKEALTEREGVGCEACHGPGSGYSDLGNHVDYSDPTRVLGYMRGIRHGMYPILGIVGRHLKNREKLCLSCHRDDRPCAPQDARTRLKKKMTIQTVDKLQRGTIRLKHPLRR
ncbi:MAG: hypothetical protein JXA20_01600 [Spirochaetes bacterium]|nr:hypothetical protein [Spirochaetota bacterium]